MLIRINPLNTMYTSVLKGLGAEYILYAKGIWIRQIKKYIYIFPCSIGQFLQNGPLILNPIISSIVM